MRHESMWFDQEKSNFNRVVQFTQEVEDQREMINEDTKYDHEWAHDEAVRCIGG